VLEARPAAIDAISAPASTSRPERSGIPKLTRSASLLNCACFEKP
jgi:hypothetical protein